MILIHHLFERIGNRISNRVDNTQFMILSESIIQDSGDGVLHRFIEQIRNTIHHTPFTFQNESSTSHRITELKHSVCKVAGSCL